MDWGESFDKITAAAIAAQVPLDALPCVTSRVDPFSHLMFEWEAFGALSTDRPVGMDRGSIPWSSLDRFAQRFYIHGEEFGRFTRLIRAMDAAYLAYLKDKNAEP